MSFKLIAKTDRGASCEVTDPATLSACAKWFGELATQAAAASANGETSNRRGPGRPRKDAADALPVTNGSDDPPPAAGP